MHSIGLRVLSPNQSWTAATSHSEEVIQGASEGIISLWETVMGTCAEESMPPPSQLLQGRESIGISMIFGFFKRRQNSLQGCVFSLVDEPSCLRKNPSTPNKTLRPELLLVSALPQFGAAHVSSLDSRCGYLYCVLVWAQTLQRRGWRPASAMIALPLACAGHTLQPPNHVLNWFIPYLTGAFTFYVPVVGARGELFFSSLALK